MQMADKTSSFVYSRVRFMRSLRKPFAQRAWSYNWIKETSKTITFDKLFTVYLQSVLCLFSHLSRQTLHQLSLNFAFCSCHTCIYTPTPLPHLSYIFIYIYICKYIQTMRQWCRCMLNSYNMHMCLGSRHCLFIDIHKHREWLSLFPLTSFILWCVPKAGCVMGPWLKIIASMSHQ